MNVSELSDYLGLSRWMIYKYIENRDIPFIPFGRLIRFDRVAVERWAEKRTVPAAGSRGVRRAATQTAEAGAPQWPAPAATSTN
jgi:excisionase family DNA binding protein